MITGQDVFPALIGYWEGEGEDSQFAGIVIPSNDVADSQVSINAFKNLLIEMFDDWKSLELYVVPLPDFKYEDLSEEIGTIIESIENDRISSDDMFSITAQDLFF